MNEIIAKLKEMGNTEAFSSPEALTEAAKKLGFSDAAIEEAVKTVGGFPLDDDALDAVAGGIGGMPSYVYDRLYKPKTPTTKRYAQNSPSGADTPDDGKNELF